MPRVVAAAVLYVFKGKAVRRQVVLRFCRTRDNGAAFEMYAVCVDVVAAFSGKQAGLDADAVAAAGGFALAEIARSFPGGTQRYLYAYARAALFVVLFAVVLNAFDVQTTFDVGIDAVGGGNRAFEGGVAPAREFDCIRLQGGVVAGLCEGMVAAFATANFGIKVDAGLGADRYADAGRYAEAAVFAVCALLRLAGFEQDVFGRIEGDGIGGRQPGVLQTDGFRMIFFISIYINYSMKFFLSLSSFR